MYCVYNYFAALAPHDDLESLGYTLLDLSVGVLPWSYIASHGVKKARQTQVLLKKERSSGVELAPEGLPFVGDIIDYARKAGGSQSLDYAWLRSQVLVNRRITGLDVSQPFSWDIQPRPLSGVV